MSKQRLLFITTGGTIASVRTAQGLKPVLTSEELLAHLPELQQLCCPETLNLCSIDSTDLGPEHWLMMAKAVQENYALYDGFIICHGTDTLAYSAAALSYLIQNADKPIILTGAQQPISNEITDAKKNLRDTELRGICLLRQALPLAYGFDLRSLTPQQKQVIVIQQILQRYLKQLRQLLHMLLRIKVPPCLLIMDVGASVDARIVCHVTLTKSFLIAIPPQLVRNFRDLRCVRKPQIELLGIQKLMWKDDRELENLKRRNF